MRRGIPHSYIGCFRIDWAFPATFSALPPHFFFFAPGERNLPISASFPLISPSPEIALPGIGGGGGRMPAGGGGAGGTSPFEFMPGGTGGLGAGEGALALLAASGWSGAAGAIGMSSKSSTSSRGEGVLALER